MDRRRPAPFLVALIALLAVGLLPGPVSGAVPKRAIRVGAAGFDEGTAVALASDGSAVILGRFRETVEFGTTSLVSAGFSDAFVARLDTQGRWLWALCAGGPSFVVANAVAVGHDGSIVPQVPGTWGQKFSPVSAGHC